MKILENISSGYKRIATGIAIVAFLSMLYLAMIPGASFAYVYGPTGGVLSGAFIFIKEWPQYNDTTDINGIYSIDNMPYGDYTLVAAGNDSYAPNITSINVSQGTVGQDITLSPAINYYLPFLFQATSDVYQAGVQVQNNGTSNASVELTLYYQNGTKAGNDFYNVKSMELWDTKVYDTTGVLPSVFAGPGKVKSNVPVQIGGYIKTVSWDVYSLASSFTDADATTNMYIPFLFHSPPTYDSGVQIFNPGNQSSEVTVTFYRTNGSIANISTSTILPKNFKGYPIGTILQGASYTGPVKITSDQPIVAQGFIRTSASGIYSIAPAISTPVTNVFIPFCFNSGTVYNSGVQVFNPGTETANVTVKFYYSNGTIGNSRTFDLPPNNMIGTPVGSMFPGVTFAGPAEIISNTSIVAQAYIRTMASNVYSVAPQVRKPASIIDMHLPLLKSSSSYNGGVQVMNPNGVDANINVKLYYANGSLANESSSVVAPFAFKGTPLASLVPGQNFTGYSIITADQSIVSQGYIRTITSNIYGVAPPVEK